MWALQFLMYSRQLLFFVRVLGYKQVGEHSEYLTMNTMLSPVSPARGVNYAIFLLTTSVTPLVVPLITMHPPNFSHPSAVSLVTPPKYSSPSVIAIWTEKRVRQ